MWTSSSRLQEDSDAAAWYCETQIWGISFGQVKGSVIKQNKTKNGGLNIAAGEETNHVGSLTRSSAAGTGRKPVISQTGTDPSCPAASALLWSRVYSAAQSPASHASKSTDCRPLEPEPPEHTSPQAE